VVAGARKPALATPTRAQKDNRTYLKAIFKKGYKVKKLTGNSKLMLVVSCSGY